MNGSPRSVGGDGGRTDGAPGSDPERGGGGAKEDDLAQ